MKSLSDAVSKRIGNNISVLTWKHGNITSPPFVATKEHMHLFHVLKRFKVKEALKLHHVMHLYTPRYGTYRHSWPYMVNGTLVTTTIDISVAGERDEDLYVLFREFGT